MAEITSKVEFKGDVSFLGAASVRDRLLDALEKSDIVSVDIGGIKSFDITFFQTLISAEKTATDQGKKLTFSSLPNVELIRMAANLGILRPETADDSWPW